MPWVFRPRYFSGNTMTVAQGGRRRRHLRRRRRRGLGGHGPLEGCATDRTGVFDMNVKMHVLIHGTRPAAAAVKTCAHRKVQLWARWLRRDSKHLTAEPKSKTSAEVQWHLQIRSRS